MVKPFRRLTDHAPTLAEKGDRVAFPDVRVALRYAELIFCASLKGATRTFATLTAVSVYTGALNASVPVVVRS